MFMVKLLHYFLVLLSFSSDLYTAPPMHFSQIHLITISLADSHPEIDQFIFDKSSYFSYIPVNIIISFELILLSASKFKSLK